MEGGGGEGKRDPRPLLLKLGFALALSIAGYLASNFNPKPNLPPPKISSESDDESKESTPKSSAMSSSLARRDELHILSSEESLSKIINGSPSMKKSNQEGFFMPKFEVKMEEEEEKSVDFEEKREMEEEIAYLRNLVEALKERERSLEMQLMQYYGLKEQEASLRELENRLKVSVMESKLLNLRIESLKTEKHKLLAQVSDYAKVVSELESAREEIEVLKKRLRLDGDEAKEKLAAVHRRISEMLERERRNEEEGVEVESKLRRLKELESEVVDLRKANSSLVEENSKAVGMLEAAKMAAASSDSDRRKVNHPLSNSSFFV